jgi:Ca2+-transporting ATPase
MRRQPRDPREALFSLPMIAWSVFQGSLAFAMLAAIFLIETWSGMPEIELRALIFFALIAAIVALILVNRSFSAALGEALVRNNAVLRYVLAAVAGVTTLILFLPRAQTLLKFGSIVWSDMMLAVGLGIGLLVLLESCKPLVRRRMGGRPASGHHRQATAS